MCVILCVFVIFSLNLFFVPVCVVFILIVRACVCVSLIVKLGKNLCLKYGCCTFGCGAIFDVDTLTREKESSEVFELKNMNF